MSEKFLIQRTEDAKDLPLPKRATPLSAGLDLHSNVDAVLKSGERKVIPTGIKIALPYGYEAQIRPRSGLALKHGIGIPNSPATIDADYRGEVHVILVNLSPRPFTVNRGDRIAQLVVAPVAMIEFTESDSLPESMRGDGGFGHSGT